ncbi:MAG: hypothetical protein WCP24_02365 [bacterium]
MKEFESQDPLGKTKEEEVLEIMGDKERLIKERIKIIRELTGCDVVNDDFEPNNPNYIDEIIMEGGCIESYVFNGRRLLRQIMQAIENKLAESGKAKKYPLKAIDPDYERFVEALDDILNGELYDRLYNSSKTIAEKSGKVKFL